MRKLLHDLRSDTASVRRDVHGFWSRHKQVIVWLTTVIVFVLFSLQQKHDTDAQIKTARSTAKQQIDTAKRLAHAQLVAVDRESYARCIDRTANVVRANEFYAKLARIEAGNTSLDKNVRDELITAFLGNIYAPPNCGPKP